MQGVQFTPEAGARIIAGIKSVEGTNPSYRGPTPKNPRHPRGGDPILIAKSPANGIPARVGDVMSSADCVLYHLAMVNETDTTGTLTKSVDEGGGDIIVRVWHMGLNAAGKDKYLQIVPIGGRYIANWEDCF